MSSFSAASDAGWSRCTSDFKIPHCQNSQDGRSEDLGSHADLKARAASIKTAVPSLFFQIAPDEAGSAIVLTRVDSCCFKSKFYRKDLIDELKISGMSSRHHIDDFMRSRIIGKIEEGRKITDVAREFDISHSVVSRLLKSFKTTGMCSRRHGGGRVRSTTPAEDRYIVLSAKRNRRTTAQQVHRTDRLQWCREHHNWTEQDWACVLFSDESGFSLSSDCRRQLFWRESGTAYRPEIIQEKDRYPTCSIMVWAGIIINGRMRLHVVANGTMTGQRYIDEILLPNVRLFRGAVGDKFVFMDDNATCHRTLAVQDCLDSEGIQRLVWPAHSPDLNPIENVWDALGRQAAGRNYPPTNKNTLIGHSQRNGINCLNNCWIMLCKDEVEKLVYQLNEEAERTETPIRRLSKIDNPNLQISISEDAEYGLGKAIATLPSSSGTIQVLKAAMLSKWYKVMSTNISLIYSSKILGHSHTWDKCVEKNRRPVGNSLPTKSTMIVGEK
ncbi:transposable element Tcb2 transposase [Trichonephila clavipes]|nr:transposable element Tcb2 transposase [Trichonephila clavipes]